jgi:NAD(P)-dependent dehydrogenase (short-subunit alcohol dehydrogenase family)
MMEGVSMSFEGKVVVITGGGGGIGKAAAARFLAEGGSVVLSSRRKSVLESAQRELDPVGERSLLVAGDVSSADAAQRVIEAASDHFGGVDVLVNSTGIFRPVPFLEQTEEHVEEAIYLLIGQFLYKSHGSLWYLL